MSEGKTVDPKIGPNIDVAGLCKSFAGERVLDGIDLSIPNGGSLVLLGESGSGKTLTLKCIMGLVKPDSGAIRIDGRDTVGLSGRERDQFRPVRQPPRLAQCRLSGVGA